MARLSALIELRDRMTDRLDRINRATERMGQEMQRMRSAGSSAFHAAASAAAGASARISGALDTISGRTERYAESSRRASAVVVQSFLAIGAAVLAAGAAPVHMSDNLQKALNNTQASTGAAEAEMAGMRDTMIEIYNTGLGESFADIGQAMATVKQVTGQTGAELQSTTQSALLLRDTFDMEVNESVRAVNTMMKQFGISSEEAYALIAQGAQMGANKNDDLLDSFNEYSVQFKALGFSAEQMTSAFIDGAENGAWSIDKVGDAVKEFNIRAKDGSKTSAEGFEALGLNAEEMTAEFAKGGPAAQKAFQTVLQSLEKMEDPVARNAAGVALFGTQFEDLEAQGILALGHISDKADMSADTLKKIGQIKFKSFGEAMTIIGRQIETGILIPIGDKILPVLSSFAQWIMTNMPAIQAAGASALNEITFAFNFVADNFDVIGPAIAAVILTIVLPALIAWATAAWSSAAATVAAFWPIIAVAAVVGAVIALLALAWKNNFLGIRDITSKVINFVMNIWNIGVNRVMALWSLVGPFVMAGLNFLYNLFVVQFTMIWGIVSLAFETIGSLIGAGVDLILGLITGLFQILTGDFSGGMATISQTVDNAIENIKSIFANFVAGAMKIGSDFAKGIVDGFLSLIGGVVDAAQNIWGRVSSIFSQKQSVSVEVSGASASAVDGSHAGGLDRVPFDGYIAKLHKDEAVLTASEAAVYRSQGLDAAGPVEAPQSFFTNEKELKADFGKLQPEKAQQILNTSNTTNTTNQSGGNHINYTNLIGSMTVNNREDIKSIVKKIENMLLEQINSSGEGVYDV